MIPREVTSKRNLYHEDGERETKTWCDGDACCSDRANLHRSRTLSHVNFPPSVCDLSIHSVGYSGSRRLQTKSNCTEGKNNYDLHVACAHSDKIRVSLVMVSVLSFNVVPQNSG